MTEVENRTTSFERGGVRSDVDENLHEAQKQADRNHCLHGADAPPTARRPIAQIKDTTTVCAAIPLTIWPSVSIMSERRAATPYASSLRRRGS